MIWADFDQILDDVGQMFRTIWGQTCSERFERSARSERSEHEHCSGTTQQQGAFVVAGYHDFQNQLLLGTAHSCTVKPDTYPWLHYQGLCIDQVSQSQVGCCRRLHDMLIVNSEC